MSDRKGNPVYYSLTVVEACVFFQYEATKNFAEDLSEGKFSFPIIRGIHASGSDGQIMSIVRQRPKDNDVKKYCVQLLRKLGVFAYTKEVLLELEKKWVQGYIHMLITMCGFGHFEFLCSWYPYQNKFQELLSWFPEAS